MASLLLDNSGNNTLIYLLKCLLKILINPESSAIFIIPCHKHKSGINFNISKYTDGQEHYNLRLECKEDGFLDCSGKIRGAVWNDYAEYRESYIKEPGRCIIETGFGDLELSTKRL